jgi:hypothetical protein
VNPDHLEPVTHAENLRRAPRTAAHFQAEKTHCAQGHPFSGDNLRIELRGTSSRRICLTCLRAYSNAYKRRVRGSA